MKIKKRIAAIILLGCCAGLTTPAIAQKKNKLKKGPNISLNISAKKDSIKTTYLNLGLLTNIYIHFHLLHLFVLMLLMMFHFS